jgi:hypothetical protein
MGLFDKLCELANYGGRKVRQPNEQNMIGINLEVMCRMPSPYKTITLMANNDVEISSDLKSYSIPYTFYGDDVGGGK